MNLFKFIKKHILDKSASETFVDLVDSSGPLIESITPEDELIYKSDEIVTICENNFLDTTSLSSIAKYKSNLNLLVTQTKERGYIECFKIIRDDDFFPYDWQWRVASKNTGVENVNNDLSYEIRTTIANQNLGVTKVGSFWIPVDNDKLQEEMSKLDRNIGSLLMPVRFRSTKHFTVNTPLSYTGEYNAVEADRNFTIIDDMSNFLSSGYAYTADYRDAYLDVTHESLVISPNAVLLISEEKYPIIMQDPVISEQLQQRRVIIYRGDEAVAINMVLTEMGVLPARPGNKYIVYDEEIRNILEQSMRNLCSNNGIAYAKGHGNLNGKGGHFSDLYDGYNHEYNYAESDFIEFLKVKFPNFINAITYHILRNSSTAEAFIEKVGVDNLLSVISEYNEMVRMKFHDRFQKYKDDRSTISKEISLTFKRTVSIIDEFYANKGESTLSINDIYQLREQICLFFHSDTVEKQLMAANKICDMFGALMRHDEHTTSNYTI